ncbi:MAG: hypothetical protein CMP10_15515 [Zetaproteobacteria bacterium]|nr:hypothetical protein [Pseudobdellovibrionaceae bacterium]
MIYGWNNNKIRSGVIAVLGLISIIYPNHLYGKFWAIKCNKEMLNTVFGGDWKKVTQSSFQTSGHDLSMLSKLRHSPQTAKEWNWKILEKLSRSIVLLGKSNHKGGPSDIMCSQEKRCFDRWNNSKSSVICLNSKVRYYEPAELIYKVDSADWWKWLTDTYGKPLIQSGESWIFNDTSGYILVDGLEYGGFRIRFYHRQWISYIAKEVFLTQKNESRLKIQMLKEKIMLERAKKEAEIAKKDVQPMNSKKTNNK